MENVKETMKEVIYSILPLSIIIIILQFTIIGMPTETFIQFLIGVIFVSVGLIFLLGVNVGLLPVGELIGSSLPKMQKIWLVVLFGFLLGFVATVAEPDLRVLGSQIDTVSGGEVSSNLIIYTVAIGVGIFVGLAMLRIVLNISITYLLVAGYGIISILSFFTPANFVPISFDSGGVTTGPMTVPFILALGVGVASVLRGKQLRPVCLIDDLLRAVEEAANLQKPSQGIGFVIDVKKLAGIAHILNSYNHND